MAPKSTLQALLFTVGSLAVTGSVPFSASATEPRLTNILPPGGQRGTELEVRFTGQRLQDTQEVIFYQPGIEVVAMDVGTNRVKATLRLAPDCPLGEHLLRLRTATGVSEVRTFWVGPFPVLDEKEPNNERAAAQKVPLNVTVHGIVAADDLDHFLVPLEGGQRLTVEIEGLRLGRGVFDPFIAIQDEAGRVLAAAEDSAFGFQDGVASITAPQSGNYVVLVRENAFGGRDDFHYRLHVGDFPRPTAVHPVAGRAGETARLKFIGDARGEFEQEVKLPAEPHEKYGVLASGAPSPNWLRITPHPTVLEAEPNETRDQAGVARGLPVVFNGVIARPGDRDWFRFRARKGENIQVNVFARQLRSPLDSAIQIANGQGAVVAENDDATGPDSALSFKPDEDGEFTLLVRDHRRRGGPDFVYCVEVAPVEPVLTLKIPEVARNDTQSRQYIAVPRGNRFATAVSVRRSGVAGDLRFRAEALPAGVRMLVEPMPPGVDQFPVVFEAALDAPVDGRLVDFQVVATNGITGHFGNDVELVQGPNNTSYYGVRAHRLPVVVTEPAPFRLRIVEPKVPLVQGGTMDLRLEADRDTGFEEPINVKMVWNPPGVTSQPDVTIPKGATNAVFPLSAKSDATLREWKIVVLASARVHGGELFVSSAPTPLTVGAPFLTATIQKSTCAPGGSTNIVVKLDQKIPFEGRATIRIVGLSDKVSVSEREITKDDTEVAFPVRVAPDCPPGSQRNLFCSVLVRQHGEVIPHNVAAGGSFRVVPVKPAEQKKVASK
ncbi:MAG TPA: PPC domain-containing protein [Methylomirabilota bacterium]|nr:PPC domain-containing protein [Methylomirabilota bacterium]